MTQPVHAVPATHAPRAAVAPPQRSADMALTTVLAMFASQKPVQMVLAHSFLLVTQESILGGGQFGVISLKI